MAISELELARAELRGVAIQGSAAELVVATDKVRRLQAAETINTSGIHPVDLRVLVKPDPVEEVTKGGIIIADATKDKQKFAGTKATLIAVGCNAFLEWGQGARKPQPGDRVHYAQYSGSWIKGDDGADYVILNDKDLTSIVEASDV
jgi:chaperonin GroES